MEKNCIPAFYQYVGRTPCKSVYLAARWFYSYNYFFFHNVSATLEIL